MKVFISHSQADRAFAERLTSRIQALGAKVVSDENAIELEKRGTKRCVRLWNPQTAWFWWFRSQGRQRRTPHFSRRRRPRSWEACCRRDS